MNKKVLSLVLANSIWELIKKNSLKKADAHSYSTAKKVCSVWNKLKKVTIGYNSIVF